MLYFAGGLVTGYFLGVIVIRMLFQKKFEAFLETLNTEDLEKTNYILEKFFISIKK